VGKEEEGREWRGGEGREGEGRGGEGRVVSQQLVDHNTGVTSIRVDRLIRIVRSSSACKFICRIFNHVASSSLRVIMTVGGLPLS
jgi:hypothetical protein